MKNAWSLMLYFYPWLALFKARKEAVATFAINAFCLLLR